MDNNKNDKYYIEKIIREVEFIIEHTEKLILKQFEEDEMLTCALCFKFTQISEYAAHISKNLKNSMTNIPWRKITGLRNLIVHDYGNVKLDIVYQTINEDLPILLKQLKQILH